jgi:predicted phosphodiesterase
MRYAVVSDLHGNRQAWKAVLTDIQSLGADRILCLGDLVGYGPAPAQVLESAYQHVQHFVLGNHDAVVAGKLDASTFNDDARRIIDWTGSQLDPRAAQFLGGLPLVMRGSGFRCAHAELKTPQRYRYILDADDTSLAWDACEEPLVFIGHSHLPALFVIGASGVGHKLEPQDFQVEPGKRYIVNGGSVGQPRDSDPRAGYCLFDSDTGDVFFRRVPFDVDAYRDDLRAAALPEKSSWFLGVADETALRPIREALDFSPPARSDSRLKRNVAVAELESVSRAARRWRLAACIFLLLFLCAGLAVARRRSGELTVLPALADGVRPPPPVEQPLLGAPRLAGAVNADNRLTEWTVVLEDSREQSVETLRMDGASSAPEEGLVGFRLFSRRLGQVFIMSSPVQGLAGTRFTAKAQFRRLAMEGGYLEVAIVEETGPGRWRVLEARQPKGLLEQEGWVRTSVTMPAGLPHAATLRFAVRGEFKGEILVRQNEFFRRE